VRKTQFILRAGDEVVAVIESYGTRVPSRGDTYLIHPKSGVEGEPSLWRVEHVHGELWPGPHDIELRRGKPLTRLNTDVYHEGDATVVFLTPSEGLPTDVPPG